MIDITKIRNILTKFRGLTILGISSIVVAGISGFFWLYMAQLLGSEQYGIVSLSYCNIWNSLQYYHF